MYICVYVCVCVCVCVCVYIYIYIYRERERDTDLYIPVYKFSLSNSLSARFRVKIFPLWNAHHNLWLWQTEKYVYLYRGRAQVFSTAGRRTTTYVLYNLASVSLRVLPSLRTDILNRDLVMRASEEGPITSVSRGSQTCVPANCGLTSTTGTELLSK
jgi:hypothetical protein